MMSDGLVTKAQALQIGKGVLRENALTLHGLGQQQAQEQVASPERAGR